MSDSEELVETIQRIRQEKHSVLPEDLVNQILDVEMSNPDNRAKAMSLIRDFVVKYVATSME